MTDYTPPPPAGAYPAPLPPKKGMPKGLKIGLIVGGVVLLLCCGGGAVALLVAGNEVAKKLPEVVASVEANQAGHTVRFEVSGPGQASTINWSVIEDSAVETAVGLPWTKTVQMNDRFGIVGINATADTGKISCKLYVDDKLVDEGESEMVVNCSATVS